VTTFKALAGYEEARQLAKAERKARADAAKQAARDVLRAQAAKRSAARRDRRGPDTTKVTVRKVDGSTQEYHQGRREAGQIVRQGIWGDVPSNRQLAQQWRARISQS
jgi:hypothetical protein